MRERCVQFSRRYATRERFACLNPALKGRAKFNRRYAAKSVGPRPRLSARDYLVQNRDQSLNITFIIKKMRGYPNTLRFFCHDHATPEQTGNHLVRTLDRNQGLARTHLFAVQG